MNLTIPKASRVAQAERCLKIGLVEVSNGSTPKSSNHETRT